MLGSRRYISGDLLIVDTQAESIASATQQSKVCLTGPFEHGSVSSPWLKSQRSHPGVGTLLPSVCKSLLPRDICARETSSLLANYIIIQMIKTWCRVSTNTVGYEGEFKTFKNWLAVASFGPHSVTPRESQIVAPTGNYVLKFDVSLQDLSMCTKTITC
jgi:hypothetical protein